MIIDQADLAFTEDEIALLYSEHFGFPIDPQQAQSMYAYTDGWIIALQLIWQHLQTSPTRQLEKSYRSFPRRSTRCSIFSPRKCSCVNRK